MTPGAVSGASSGSRQLPINHLGAGVVTLARLVVEVQALEKLARFLVGLLHRVVEATAGRAVDPVLGVVHGVERRVVDLVHCLLGAPEEPPDGIEQSHRWSNHDHDRRRLLARPRATAARCRRPVLRRDGIRLWTALWIVYLAWGSTYVAIKLAVRTLPPLLTAGTRFLAASAILAGVAVVLRRSLRVERREALAAAGIGVALLSLGVGLVHVAETRIDSGVAAMIAGSVPLQIVVWRLAAGERVPRQTTLAALVGLAGLALVVGPDGFAGGATAVGLLVMLVASISWSSGSFVSGRLRLPGDPVVAAVYEMLGGGLVLVVAALAVGEASDLDTGALEPGPIAAWAYLALVGSVLGFTAYVWLLDNAPISQVVTHQYVNPLVAVMLGAVLLEERPGAATLVGAALIVGAVVVTARREGRRDAVTRRSSSAAPRETRADPTG